MKHSINIPVDHEEKKIYRVSWFTGIDLFPLGLSELKLLISLRYIFCWELLN